MNKLTDNEIIKAFKICESEYLGCEDGCPFNEECKKDTMAIGKAILDLINRQKAEIERLNKAGEEAVSCFTRMESLYKIKCKELEVAKSEAIKEFWDELSKKCARTINVSIFSGKPYVSLFVREDIAEELVKEMVGE